MDPERWRRVSQAFEELCDLPAEERPARLAQLERESPEVAAEVGAMLVADRTARGAMADGALAFAAEPTGVLTAGARLGPYEIVAPLGAGGMGEVYRARDTRLGREVAVKVLRAPFVADPARLRRFEQEARAASTLNHPNILVVFDVGRHEAVSYLVTELLTGETLRARLRGGAVPVSKAVEIAGQIARGLAAAHEKGIVHRDLKPENLFVTSDGVVKILDFGIAKLLAPEAGSDAIGGGAAPIGTASGVILGTPSYMAPEQVRGFAVDGRTDLFAFGAILYELLAGERAFRGDSPVETMHRVLEQEPPHLAESGGRIPPALDRLVRHCLEKRPEERFQSARDLAFQLGSLSDQTAPTQALTASPPARRIPRWTLAFALALPLVIAVAVIVPQLRRRDASQTARPSIRFEVAPPPGGGFESGIALTRDGSQLAFVAPGPQGQDLAWVRPLAASAPRALAGTEGASYPFWSPDGRRLAFFAKGKLKTVDVAGGEPQTLCVAASPRGGAWSDRGVLIVALEAGARIARVAASGGEPVTLPGGADASGVGLVRFPELLPDGHRFLYFRLASQSASGVWIGDLDSAERTFLVASDSSAVYAAPGFLVFRRGERLLAQRFDAGALRLQGTPTTLSENVWWNGTSTLQTPIAASTTGVLAFRTGGPERSQLIWFDRQGHSSAALGPPGAYIEPAISPDGRRVAVTRAAEDGSSVDIWLLDAERGGLARFTSGPWYSATPVWSPDGRQIVYVAFPSPQVMRRDASGIGHEEVLWKGSRFSPVTDWSRDGTSLFLCELDFRTFLSDVTRLSLAGERLLQPLLAQSYTECGARLSPDGKWLAYESDESGIEEVIVRSYPDLRERWPISTGGGTQPRWRGDGAELYFVAPDRRLMAVEVRTSPRFATRLTRALFATHIMPLVEARNQYDVTADGQRFLVNSRRPEDATRPIVVLVDWAAGLLQK